MKTAKIKTKGMHCESCEKLIIMALEDLAGIKKVDASFKTGIVNVVYDETKINEADIVKAIKSEGYKI